MNGPKLFDRVSLTRDIKNTASSMGTVDPCRLRSTSIESGSDGMIIEVTNAALGESLRVVIVAPADIEPLHADEVLTVRQLAGRLIETGPRRRWNRLSYWETDVDLTV